MPYCTTSKAEEDRTKRQDCPWFHLQCKPNYFMNQGGLHSASRRHGYTRTFLHVLPDFCSSNWFKKHCPASTPREAEISEDLLTTRRKLICLLSRSSVWYADSRYCQRAFFTSREILRYSSSWRVNISSTLQSSLLRVIRSPDAQNERKKTAEWGKGKKKSSKSLYKNDGNIDPWVSEASSEVATQNACQQKFCPDPCQDFS